MRTTIAIVLTLALFVPAATAQVMIPDSSGDRIMLFDAYDGSLINADWLTDAAASGWEFSTPKEAVMVGGQLWVADQIEDAVFQFDADLSYVGTITGGNGKTMDNVRSLGTDGSTVYVTNSAGDFDDAVIKFDTTGSYLGFFPVESTSIFDAEPFEGDLLITDADNDRVDRYGVDGGFLSTFADGLGFAEQVAILDDGSVIVANAIDSAGIEGLWHYNADGSLRAFVDTDEIGGPTLRGGELLGNGSYILSTGDGIWTATPDGGGFIFNQVFADASGQYVTFVPEPGALALLVVGGLAVLRRRA